MSRRFSKGSRGLWNQNSAVKVIAEGEERDSGVHVCLWTVSSAIEDCRARGSSWWGLYKIEPREMILLDLRKISRSLFSCQRPRRMRRMNVSPGSRQTWVQILADALGSGASFFTSLWLICKLVTNPNLYGLLWDLNEIQKGSKIIPTPNHYTHLWKKNGTSDLDG